MRDNVLWRKQSRIIMLLAETLHIPAERASIYSILQKYANSWLIQNMDCN